MIALWLLVAFAAGYFVHVAASGIVRRRAVRPVMVEPAPLPEVTWDVAAEVPDLGSLEARRRYLADHFAGVIVRQLDRRRS